MMPRHVISIDFTCFFDIRMFNEIWEGLQMTEAESKEIIKSLTITINNLNEEIALLREQVAYLTQKRYGKSSKQMPLSDQTSLFEEDQTSEDDDLPKRRARRDYYL